jgi:hypothetical protein
MNETPIVSPVRSRWSLTRVLTFVSVAVVLTFAVVFVVAVVLVNFNADGVERFVSYVRDILTVFVITQCVLILTGLSILILQFARFINLLGSEVKPITEDVREATQAIRSSAEFVNKQAVQPVIRSTTFFIGLRVFLRELFRFARLFRKPTKGDPS